MHFRVLGEITDAETIAAGSGIREIAGLRKRYGRGPVAETQGCRRNRAP
jgi:hypothetical protein